MNGIYSARLENTCFYKKSADYVFMILFGIVLITVALLLASHVDHLVSLSIHGFSWNGPPLHEHLRVVQEESAHQCAVHLHSHEGSVVPRHSPPVPLHFLRTCAGLGHYWLRGWSHLLLSIGRSSKDRQSTQMETHRVYSHAARAVSEERDCHVDRGCFAM